MAAILSLREHLSKQDIQPYSITDMIFNPIKRKSTYDYYAKTKIETQEEKDIFEMGRNRRMRKDD